MLLTSKLPKTGLTIFSKMSALAHEYGAINMAQGFPDFETDPELIELVHKYMLKGYNQYAPMAGVIELREQIAQLTYEKYEYLPDANNEITITTGATEAVYVAISSVVNPGDEVIILEPAFDSYIRTVELCGGVPISVPMHWPNYTIDWPTIREKVTHKTKLIIINSPHNPTGTIINIHDIHELQSLVEETNMYILSDEVYEHIVFDELPHESILKYQDLRERSFVVSSLGKTFNSTGWRLGYCIAPPIMTSEFRKIHQYVTFAPTTPIQYAIASFIDNRTHINNLAPYLQQKRDLFYNEIKKSKLTIYPSRGTYFQLASYQGISELNDIDFCQYLTKELKLACIPVSYFYENKQDEKVIRFCIAKKDETLIKAAEIIQSL